MGKFKKNKEDFSCENCGEKMQGSGYTNHCLKCLWSKHVNVNPGDREETCGGMMKPERVISKKDSFIITHVCQKCGFERNQTISEKDNFEAVLAIEKSANQS